MVFQHFGSVQLVHHVYLSWQLGGIRDCRVDCILGRPKFSFFKSMRSISCSDECWKRVGCSTFYGFPERVRVHPQSWARQLLHYGRQGKGGGSCQSSFSCSGICAIGSWNLWVLEHNKASLPLGGLSSTTWIRRLQSVSIFRPVDACNPWTWKGRTMSTSVLVRFYMAEEGTDAGFVVSGTIAETLAGWDAAEWSTDARGLGAGIDFATARGFRVVSLEMSIPIIKLNLLPFFSVLFRALRLPDPHVI